jgi:hypothetical protein
MFCSASTPARTGLRFVCTYEIANGTVNMAADYSSVQQGVPRHDLPLFAI